MYRGLSIGVVVPAYNEARLLPETLASMPDYVDEILVVDDASGDDTAAVVESLEDPRIQLIRHAHNQGVGAAIVTGYKRAVERGLDAAAVMAADAQMDPADLSSLIDALIDEESDYVKGDRLAWPGVRAEMPPVRRFGTTVLGYLTRIPSGYGNVRDSQCGYTVARCSLLQSMPLDDLYPRYGFPNDMIVRVAEADGRLSQRPVRPVYETEESGLKVHKVIGPISRILAAGSWRRLKRVTTGRFGRSSGLTGLVLGSLFLGFMLGFASGESSAGENDEAEVAAAEFAQHTALFREALEVVDAHYVETVDLTTLVHYGAWGATATLDKHSRFMPPTQYKSWNSRIHGKNIGPGFEVVLENNDFLVESISPESPASRANIREGDVLLAIDGEALEMLNRKEVRRRLRGEAGTVVLVRMRQKSDGEIVEHELFRERVKAVPVIADLLPGGIGHIQLRSFQDDTATEVFDAYNALIEANGGPLDGLVLDLRDNLGGLLDEAIYTADLFLPADKVVVSLRKRGKTTKVHKTRTQTHIDAPLVIIVNGRSASASELLAAALRDHARGSIIGWPTYGKGSVQSTYSLAGNSGLKITTSMYFTPNDVAIDGDGLTPDIQVVAKPRKGQHKDAAIAKATELVRKGVVVHTAVP